MDEKDVAPSPDWDTARSGISKGLHSSGTSSSNLSGLRHGSSSLKTSWYTNDKPEIVTIYPQETTKCAQLVLTIQKAEQLQPVLQTTVDILQRHAKWFTQDGLEALLQHALSRASESSSTADLDVAIDLIDAAMTFAILPLTCVQPSVKFIAFTYHHGMRMNKHRNLATKAWELYQHFLHSHLGPLSVDALLEVLDKEETQWSRSSFASVSGALRLLDEKFILGSLAVSTNEHVSVTELLLKLKNVVTNGDDVLKEQVIILLCKVLTNKGALAEVEAMACWAVLIDLVERCDLTAEDTSSKALLDRLATVSPYLEPAQLTSLSTLFVRLHHPLSKEIASQLLIPVKPINRINVDSSEKYNQLLHAFSQNNVYSDELQELAQNDLDFLMLCEQRDDWNRLVRRYMKLISSPDLPREAAITCAAFLCALFHSAFETSYLSTRLWKVTLIFDAITKLAVSAPRPEARLCALRALSRLRVTISGYVYIEEDESANGAVASGTTPGAVLLSDLPRKLWLDEVLQLLRDADLEQNTITSSFVLMSLPAQLGNLLFFVDQKEHVRAFHDIAIKQLTSANNTNSASYIRILTSLINYRGLFSSSEERHMVDLFIRKAGSSEVISKDCIHALTLCCHETPETIARELDNVVQKMAQMITQKHLAIHVLEFLTGLSRLPNLFRNFRTDDFRKIFGVCISYLQSLRDGQMSRQSTTVSSDNASSSHLVNHEILPQYVYSLAHHVIVFWYIVLRPDDRQLIKTYVTNSLCYRREGDKDVPDDQGLVVIDFMERVDTEAMAHSGPRALADEGLDEIFDEVDGKIMSQHRICGMVLISTHTSLRTAKTLVTTRRPSGTAKYLVYGRNAVTRESWSSAYLSPAPASVWSGSAGEDETMTIYSDDVDGQSYGTVTVPSATSPLGSSDVVTLPEDASLDRAIAIFDRTPGLDSHKAGVIYIGEGQSNEEDILANSSGSPDYREIVENLGKLQELRGAMFNTQGLDTREGTDGDYVMVWNNEITELVFHVTTMMPTDIKDKHMSAIRKKAHIGNDHVNIIFNNSGLPFKFDTFPSQFNYVYIIITPSVRTTFLQTRTHTVNTNERNRFYRVEVMTHDDFPSISAAAEPKMISGASLPGYVRNLALNACVFSEVWVNRDSEEYKSSWRTRLNQIRRLEERYAVQGTARRSSVVTKGKGKAQFWK